MYMPQAYLGLLGVGLATGLSALCEGEMGDDLVGVWKDSLT